jgi:hypothetical protein
MNEPRKTRAERLAMPLARDVVKELALQNGACIRPVQLRRTDMATGRTEPVLVPCGHTLASVCPPCAERAKNLRAAQCREGWHLEQEPVIEPDEPTDEQSWLVQVRADAQALRDADETPDEDVTGWDDELADLDEEINEAGIRPPPRTPRLCRPPRAGLPQVVGQDPRRPPGRPQSLADGDAGPSGN